MFDRRITELMLCGYREHVLTAGPQGITAATAGSLLLWVASWYAPERTSEQEAVDYMVAIFSRASGPAPPAQ
jgi:hypothetical protein